MAIVLHIKAFVLLLCFLALFPCTDSLEDGTQLVGETIKFQALPKGISYKVEKPASQWILSSYEDIARTLVYALKSNPPYGRV